MTRRLQLLASLLLAVGLAACGKRIGDGCSVNVDCSPAGDRFCDTAAPGGYCTVEGCDVATCPGEAVCVRFLSLLPQAACNPTRPFPESGCRADEVCLCEDAACARALCAPESSERRWCQKTCEKSADCREGFECRSTGARGAEPVPQPMDGGTAQGVPAKFCAPAPRG